MNKTKDLKNKAVILSEESMTRAISRMTYQIIEKNSGQLKDLVFIGIYSRGCDIAKSIIQKMEAIENKKFPVGFLNITPFRDDKPLNTESSYETNIPFSYKDKTVILVDDVMYTGRSVRAAIDGIMAGGRPKNIQLAVLVDRGHRELPIRPDYVGKNIPTAFDEVVKVKTMDRDGENSVILYSI